MLFDIKYKNGRRIKAFESVVLEFLYDMQSAEIDRNPEYKHHYLICLEEIQKFRFLSELEYCFGTYSMNSDDSLELFTVFTQSRSDANIHYIAIVQRLNDISCKVVERLRPFIGLTLSENSLRKLKSMIPDDAIKKRIQQLPKRHSIYLDGKENAEIEIPFYKKEGAITYIKPVQQPEQQQIPKVNLGTFIKCLVLRRKPKAIEILNSAIRQPATDNTETDNSEESELDLYMSGAGDNSIMFPSDKPEEF